eukprot:3974832-Karenia_brevis.AAC.1
MDHEGPDAKHWWDNMATWNPDAPNDRSPWKLRCMSRTAPCNDLNPHTGTRRETLSIAATTVKPTSKLEDTTYMSVLMILFGGLAGACCGLPCVPQRPRAEEARERI